MENGAKKSLSIKKEIFLLSFLFFALVSLIFAGIFLKILYDNNMDNARNSLRQCNSQVVTYIGDMFHENVMIVKSLSKNPAVIHGEKEPEAVLSIYDGITRENSKITYVYSGYADGTLLINNYPTPQNYDSTERPWYKAAEHTDGVAQTVYCDAATREWLISQSTKLLDERGRTAGIVAIDCSSTSITRQLSARYQYDSQRSYIIGPAGTVLIHPEENYINDSLLNYMDSAIWSDVVNGISNYGEYQKNGVGAMAYFERIPGSSFLVVTAIDASEVTRPIIRSLIYLLAMVVCISIALGFVLSQVLMYRFARPIIALERRIRNVAGGLPDNGHEFHLSNREINGIADSIEVIVTDIARQEEQRRTAEYMSFHDSMTGVYNRRYFEQKLRVFEAECNYPLCFVCCDVNNLKLVNDVFGHDAGDELIEKVAKCLQSSCRADDVLARTGGDEFAVMMPRVSDGKAQMILQRMRERFSEESVCGMEVTASLGYAIKETKEESLEEVLQQADKMMYAEKVKVGSTARRNMFDSILAAAEKEGIASPLSGDEEELLHRLALNMCPESEEQLKKGYRLRKIGLCTAFRSGESGEAGERRHTEIGYRVLGAFDEYRGVAGCVLHCTEHWDGTGGPVGLAGWDIPLMSRIIGAADAYLSAGGEIAVMERNRTWYDPQILAVLEREAPLSDERKDGGIPL